MNINGIRDKRMSLLYPNHGLVPVRMRFRILQTEIQAVALVELGSGKGLNNRPQSVTDRTLVLANRIVLRSQYGRSEMLEYLSSLDEEDRAIELDLLV